jgi:hypothetical protein
MVDKIALFQSGSRFHLALSITTLNNMPELNWEEKVNLKVNYHFFHTIGRYEARHQEAQCKHP